MADGYDNDILSVNAIVLPEKPVEGITIGDGVTAVYGYATEEELRRDYSIPGGVTVYTYSEERREGCWHYVDGLPKVY